MKDAGGGLALFIWIYLTLIPTCKDLTAIDEVWHKIKFNILDLKINNKKALKGCKNLIF